MTIRLQVDTLPDSLRAKLMFAWLNGNDEINSGGGEYSNGFLEIKTRKFGRYVVAIDTIAPEIKFGGLKKGSSEISFKISDELSGIKSYKGLIDGEWALFKFDSKSGKLTCSLEEKRVSPGEKHVLELIVTDYKDNRSVFKNSFTY
jgi:hypothetical protein